MLNFEDLKRIRAATAEQLADVALLLAATEPYQFLQLFSDEMKRYEIRRPISDEYPQGEYLGFTNLRQSEVTKIQAAGGERGGKIAAIKAVREITGLGLLESKLLVEEQGWYRRLDI